MEEYKLGALGDLISGGKSPGKGLGNKKSPNKRAAGTPNSKAGPIANATPNAKRTPMKRKSNVGQNPSPKKVKQLTTEEDDEDDEAEENQNNSIEFNPENDAAEDSDEDEEVDEEEDMDQDEAESDEEGGEDNLNEEDDDNDSDEEEEDDDDEPEEQSSKLTNEKKGDASKLRELFTDRTIFVGNIKIGLQKKLVIKHFKKYGVVESVRFRSVAVENPMLGKKLSIQKNKLHAQRTTCNAYVRFANVESAQKAVEGENGKEFYGLHMRVTMSCTKSLSYDNKKTLFVGNLSFKAEEEALWTAFASCGEIESVRIVRDKRTNVSRGFGYVNFKSPDSVQLAMEMGDVVIFNRTARLSTSEFVQKEKTLDPANDCCVFIAGFSAGTPKGAVISAFQKIGPVAKVRLVKDKFTHKNTGCGFVTFKNTEAAQTALQKEVLINNQLVQVQVPRTTLKGARKARTEYDASPKKFPAYKGMLHLRGPKPKGRVGKPLKKNEKRKSTGGSPPKSFQGSQGKTKGENDKGKVNRGQLMKKKMAKKVAPRA
ncbi:RNA-binding protein 34-like [Atheta coriaria]|uniref:RNA-binding protein 34-like n=1 Tax=Dalotia coriaria TaxID=877792 RepID=UPI0031F44DC4